LDGEALHDYRIRYTIISGKANTERRTVEIDGVEFSWPQPNWYNKPVSRHADGTGDQAMDEDRFNMSIRKFLKVVGVTSQREIENAVRAAVAAGRLKGNETLKAKVTLTLSGVALTHDIDGDIELG
jgi:hypothetical protein